MGDANSIAKLLEQLSSSTAWQQAVAGQGHPSASIVPPESGPAAAGKQRPHVAGPPKSHAADVSMEDLDVEDLLAEPPSDKVGALLELLGSTKPTKGIKNSNSFESGEEIRSPPQVVVPYESNQANKDLHHVSFAEALQAVTKLAQSPTVIKHLKEIRDEQNRLEQRYWESRQQTVQKQRKMVEELKTQVSITGSLGSRERLKASFQRELSSLDRDEFLPAWDRLLSRQQATLQRMNVPLMFETSDVDARRKQQQILTVLEGLIEQTE